jgi:peptidoglycan/LPS O-acetylase OafA/YrhL
VNAAVDGFFLLSGFVLARSYDGRFVAFVVRRFVRLWPVYALCLTAGYALNGMTPIWPELIWWPTDRLDHLGLTDKPVWTLYIEAWAAPLLPALVAIARTNRVAGLLIAGVLFLAQLLLANQTLLYFSLFAGGVAAAQFRLTFPAHVPAWSSALGQIAYSLYLTNWLVLVAFSRLFGPAGAFFAIPAIFAVAWAVWWAVERPSIALSRRLGGIIAASRRPAAAIVP